MPSHWIEVFHGGEQGRREREREREREGERETKKKMGRCIRV